MNLRNRNCSEDVQASMTQGQSMTQEQSDQLFVIARQTALAEQNAAAAKFQLEQNYLKVESAARIVTLSIAPSATLADLRRHPLDEKDNDIGEIPLEAKSIIHCFLSLSKKYIICIFCNKFRPINLFRF